MSSPNRGFACQAAPGGEVRIHFTEDGKSVAQLDMPAKQIGAIACNLLAAAKESSRLYGADTILLRYLKRIEAIPLVAKFAVRARLGWEPVRKWWLLWLALGLSTGAALALWLQPDPPLTIKWKAPLEVIGDCVPADTQNALKQNPKDGHAIQEMVSAVHNRLISGKIEAQGQQVTQIYDARGNARPSIQASPTFIRAGEWHRLIVSTPLFTTASATDGISFSYVALDFRPSQTGCR